MPRPGLAQAGRRQVDDDPPQRELEAAVDQRRPHPLPRLPDRGVGKADDREAGQAAVDVDLDPDRAGGDAVEGEGRAVASTEATLGSEIRRVVRASQSNFFGHGGGRDFVPTADLTGRG